MPRRVTFRCVMIALTCAISISATAMADAPRQVDVPSGDLATALQKLAEQSGVEFIYSVEQIKGIHTGGVHGEYTAEKAVTKLLEGTKLKLTVHKSGAILIAAPNPNALSNASGSTAVRDPSIAESASNSSPRDHLQLAQSGQGSDPQDVSVNTDAQTSNRTFESKDELEEITVTGSHLRTTEAAIAAPVIVITADDIKKMGFNTVEDVIRSLSQNFSSVNAGTTLDGSQFSTDARGQSAADLRGLGPDSTLVLVNGRRRAVSSTFGDIVNLNTIPMGSIDRIEIMTDGASAVYGSDAVAGVINFILKKDYQGGETHVREEVGHNGGDSLTFDQSLGETWSSGNITFSGRFAKTDPVTSIRAGDTTQNLTSLGGDDFRDRRDGQPGLVQGLGSLPAGDNGTTGIAGKLSPANTVPLDLAQYATDLTTGTKTYSFDINIEQKLTDWVRAYGEVSVARNTSESIGGPGGAFFQTVPTTNIYNNLGVPVTVNYVFGNETRLGLLPPQAMISDQKNLGGVLGFKITLPQDWTLDISANHSREDASYNALAVDSTLLNERASGVDANGNPLPASQQLNLFGNGTAQNPAALAGLMKWGLPGEVATDNFSTSDSALLTAEGSLLTLPGGDLRLATGGEFRREELNYATDDSRSTQYVTTSPSRTVKAAFGELNIPLVGERNRIPGVYALNLYGAARWEQYAISGPFDGAGAPDRDVDFTHLSPKAGISWFPWQELKVRGTFSKSFRAPSLTDLFGSSYGPYTAFGYIDPKNPGLGTIYPNTYFTGNPNVGPETATSYTAGLDWKPMGSLRGLAATLTYSRIDFDNLITSSSAYMNDPAILFSLPGVITRNAAGQVTSVNLGPINIASRLSQSVDARLSYGMDTRVGQLTFGVSGTYTIKLEDNPGPGFPTVRDDATQNGPERVKARSWVSWSRREYGANVYANYSSSYMNTNVDSPTGLAPQSVDHYTTFDLNGFYNLPGGFSVNAGVRNLTNAAFPFINYEYPFDTRRVDLRGRTFYLEFASKYKL
jgi:iron complex outermembrane recepter protein